MCMSYEESNHFCFYLFLRKWVTKFGEHNNIFTQIYIPAKPK